MKTVSAENSVQAWNTSGVLFETYRYGAGSPNATPLHAHEEYQFCLSLNFPGETVCRGARTPIPARGLSIVHPGEAHASRDLQARPYETVFRLLYVPPPLLKELAIAENAGTTKHAPEPFFADTVLMDEELFGRFLLLHTARERGATCLEAQTSLLTTFSLLLAKQGHKPQSSGTFQRERRAVNLAREYLDAHYACNVSLDELARVVDLKPLYLCRLFRREVGVSPHAYQLQRRIMQAKQLLLSGFSPGQTACEVGFYDQSHFGRYFKRIVGVTPARYGRP